MILSKACSMMKSNLIQSYILYILLLTSIALPWPSVQAFSLPPSNQQEVPLLAPGISLIDDNRDRLQCKIVASGDSYLPPVSSSSSSPSSSYLEDPLTQIFKNQETEENKSIQEVVKLLYTAGYSQLTKRDLDLSLALNSGYLLKLSIDFDFKSKDELMDLTELIHMQQENKLFGGRVLVFRRGYSSEITKARLFLPKLDFLQANIVQRVTKALTDKLSVFEDYFTSLLEDWNQIFQDNLTKRAREFVEDVTKEGSVVEKALLNKINDQSRRFSEKRREGQRKSYKSIQLQRYGGKNIYQSDLDQALDPFLICDLGENDEVEANDLLDSYVNRETKEGETLRIIGKELLKIDRGTFIQKPPLVTCLYDSNNADPPSSIKLLERASIGSICNIGSVGGRRRLARQLLSLSELIEPTYEELVVIWLPNNKQHSKKSVKIKHALSRIDFKKPSVPKFVYDFAEVFEVEDRLPGREKDDTPSTTQISRNETQEGEYPNKKLDEHPFEIRVFQGVPLSNLLAVLPKTRLVFRPADALRIDAVSTLTLVSVLATQRFDNPKFDLIALISVSLWLLRTFFRYSNILARYDLLVNKFLTSKIAQRGKSALSYLCSQSSIQRARKVCVVYDYLREQFEANKVNMRVAELQQMVYLIDDQEWIEFDVEEVLVDLKELELINITDDCTIEVIDMNETEVINNIRSAWIKIFDDRFGKNEDTEMTGFDVNLFNVTDSRR